MHLDQALDDREPESQTAVTAGGRWVGLPESIEDERQEIGTNTDACIFYADLDVRVHPFQNYGDPAAARGKFHGVGEDIPQNLLQPIRIASHQTNLRIQQRTDTDVLRRRGLPHGIERLLDDLM